MKLSLGLHSLALAVLFITAASSHDVLDQYTNKIHSPALRFQAVGHNVEAAAKGMMSMDVMCKWKQGSTSDMKSKKECALVDGCYWANPGQKGGGACAESKNAAVAGSCKGNGNIRKCSHMEGCFWDPNLSPNKCTDNKAVADDGVRTDTLTTDPNAAAEADAAATVEAEAAATAEAEAKLIADAKAKAIADAKAVEAAAAALEEASEAVEALKAAVAEDEANTKVAQEKENAEKVDLAEAVAVLKEKGGAGDDAWPDDF